MQTDVLHKKANSRWKRVYRWLEMMADHIDRHDLFRFSACIAYTTALSIAPFLLVVLSIVAFLDLGIQSDILGYLYAFIGEDTAHALDIVITNTRQTEISSLSGIFGLIILAFSASAMFSNLRTSLDRIAFSETPPEATGVIHFIKQKVLSVLLVFAFILIIVFSIFLTIVMKHFYMPKDAFAAEIVAFTMNFVLFVIVFTLLYRFVPTTKVSWNRCMISGSISSVCFLIGKSLIGVYLSQSIVSNSVGALGTIIVFLIWVYYVSLVILISYEATNAFYIRARKRKAALA